MRIEAGFKKSGFFWLPNNKDEKIPGILTIHDGGKIELDVIGIFGGIQAALDDKTEIHRIIGNIENDGLITLENCFYINKTASLNDGISKSKILAHTALLGAGWEENEPIMFDTFCFSVDCLQEWVETKGITIQRDLEKKEFSINYKKPNNIAFNLDDGITLEIVFLYKTIGDSNPHRREIIENTCFRLCSKNHKDLSYFISISHKITNLMCFAMDETVSIKNISATLPEINSETIQQEEHSKIVSIFFPSTLYSEKTPMITSNDMLFTLSDITQNNTDIFNKWINSYEYLWPSLALYFSTKIGAYKYVTGNFLSLVQAIETYHRRTSSETLMPASDFNNLVDTIISKCPKENRQWLQSRLAYGNEISLRQRIKKIIEPFENHLGTRKTVKVLIKKIVDTRNYLTHYSKELEDKSAKGKDLRILCLKMEAILNLHFLSLVGFSNHKIKHIIEQNRPIQLKMEKHMETQ